MKRLFTAAFVAGGMLAASASMAGAVTIVDIGTVEAYSNPEDAFYAKTDQTLFSTSGGLTTIDILGSGFIGGPNTDGVTDSYLYLLRDDGDLTADDFVDQNDDSSGFSDGSVSTLDSFLSLNLTAGNYIAIVGYCCDFFNSTTPDARDLFLLSSGYQAFNGTDPEDGKSAIGSAQDYKITISGDGITPVPIPAALPLLLSALGFFGFLGWRRKKVMGA